MQFRSERSIGDILKDRRNIILKGADAATRGGFTQVPNFLLKSKNLSAGDKLAFAILLSYAWQNDYCFPGQERLAEDMGLSRSRVTEFVGELEKAGLITIQRRGLGKTNVYTIHFYVKRKGYP